MINHPVAEIKQGSHDNHQDWKNEDISSNFSLIEKWLWDGSKYDESEDNSEDKDNDEELFFFVILIEGENWIVADNDWRVSEEAEV